MEKERKSNKGLIGIIVILVVIIIALTTIIIMDKLDDNENKTSNDNTNVTENNNIKDNDNTVTDNNKENEVSENKEESIKIPNNLVGKYVNKNNKDDYFILKSDGTAQLSFITGDGNRPIATNEVAKFKILYLSEYEIIIEFYNGTIPFSPIKIGNTSNNGFIFADTQTGPGNNAFEFVYQK